MARIALPALVVWTKTCIPIIIRTATTKITTEVRLSTTGPRCQGVVDTTAG